MSSVASPAQATEKKSHSSFPPGNALHGNGERHGTALWQVLGPAFMDILLVGASGLIAYRLRFSGLFYPVKGGLPRQLFEAPHGTSGIYLGFLLVYATLLVLVAYSQKLYNSNPNSSRLMDSLMVLRAVTVATVILTAFIYLSGIKTVSRLVVALTAGFSLLMLIGWRLCQWHMLHRRLARGIGLRHAVIIGAGNVGTMLADYLQATPALGYDVRGFLDLNHHNDPRLLGTLDDLARVARQEFVDEVFITIPSERELVKQLALEAMQLNVSVKVVPELYDGLAWQCPLEFVGDVPVRALHREPIPAFGLFLKRMTDVVVSAIGLTVLFPVLALIALSIKIDSDGPVFYRSYRMGKKGRKFLCYKFRTMVPEADKMKDALKHLNEREGLLFKISNDPRLTRLGRFLRRYSVDELPQLWNVLRGEMSLVGPRPPSPDEFQNYKLEHFRRLDVTPGITGLWQTEARHDPSFEKAVALDSKYIEIWSYLLDMRILLRTIPAVLKGTGR
jgi:exopolysaccharide biosynthesis polyprenyl glycosylphosphotransferase